MTKKLLFAALAIALVIALAHVALSLYSRRAPQLGLVDGRLRPCPDSPNCVCSDTVTANIEPLRFAGDAATAWTAFADTVAAEGGQVVTLTHDYLHATFETSYLRFVDDFEARLDRADSAIHVRSGSRVGYSDRGVNRTRVERLRGRYRAAGDGG